MHTKRDSKNPRIVLEEDHRHIDSLLERLVVQVRADDRAGGAKAWRKVETVILAHLDTEEMFILPALAREHPAEASRLRDEHCEIRRMLGEIGLAFDLHTVRCEGIESFCAMLHDHAEREEATLYPLAERQLTVSLARSIFERLRGAATALVNARAPARRSSSRVARSEAAR